MALVDEVPTQVLGRKTKLRRTYARRYRTKTRLHDDDIYDVPLSPPRKSQHSRRQMPIIKRQVPQPMNDSHTTASGSQKSPVKGSSAALSLSRRPLPDSTDEIPQSAPQMPARSSSKILEQSGRRLPRKLTALSKKRHGVAKVEAATQDRFPPTDTNHACTDVSTGAVPNEHTGTGGPGNTRNLGYAAGIETAARPDYGDEYFFVEGIKSCELGSTVRWFVTSLYLF